MFNTRTQAAEYLVGKGMSQAFAKVTVDQQYNYGEGDELLRGNNEDLSVTHVATVEELDMVYDTWIEILSVEDEFICVDGEPTYNLQGDLL